MSPELGLLLFGSSRGSGLLKAGSLGLSVVRHFLCMYRLSRGVCVSVCGVLCRVQGGFVRLKGCFVQVLAILGFGCVCVCVCVYVLVDSWFTGKGVCNKGGFNKKGSMETSALPRPLGRSKDNIHPRVP